MADAHDAFLGPFAGDVVQAVTEARAAGAVVVGADDRLRAFRRNPAAALAAIGAMLEDLWPRARPHGRVIWCVAGEPGLGLDRDELAAVLGRAMHLDLVEQVAANDEKRLVAVGTIRREFACLAVEPPVGQAATPSWLDALAQLGLPVLAFLPVSAAATLAADEAGRAAAAALAAAGGALGWLVTSDERDAVMADPGGGLAVFERLGGARPRFVRFADSADLEAAALASFMERTGASVDASLEASQDAPGPGTLSRTGPFAGGAPYHPQPFDLRVPVYRFDGHPWIELPRVAVSAGTARSWWQGLRAPADEALAGLLDASRMEAFFRLSRVDPAEERRYPDVRVYNWPAPAPAGRVTLLDAGPVPLDALRALADALAGIAAAADGRLTLEGPAGLADRAAAEMAARYGITSERAISIQGAAHGYLASLPHDAPLREDYAHFARFVPARLGDALELGSGYGVLAWALAPRASRYTCLDLDRRMFARLRPDLHQQGVVADMHRLPFADASFDSVVANNVLEHLYEPLAGLAEIRRILRPGGRVLALVPFDALNPRHDLPAHHWKLDEEGVRRGVEAAALEVDRLEVVNLYDLRVGGAFPTCYGFAAMVDAARPAEGRAVPPGEATPQAPGSETGGLAGRLLPLVREQAGFERWSGRRVVTVGSHPADVDEFRYYGADVVHVGDPRAPWPMPDGAADLVYAFLSLSRSALPGAVAEIRRVLRPGGLVVAGFRNRHGLRYLVRLHRYFGGVCGVTGLAGPDGLVRLGDDDGALVDGDYVTRDEVAAAFESIGGAEVGVHHLTPEDLPAIALPAYEPGFWAWLAEAGGRFILVRAVK